jgi:alkylation response protein AidB-like acyl-CoA dehydrogenase
MTTTMTTSTIATTVALSTPPDAPDGLGAELGATTAAGAAMIATAERLADEFAPGALAHDRDATFASEHLERLRDDGFLVAPVARWLGGGGVDSVHDVLVAMSRLARGDASTTIGVNMHFAVLLNVVRRWRVANARDEAQPAAALGATLRTVAEAGIVFATAVSEPAPQDLTRPATRAERVDGGWRISGRKVFATMAPAATIVNVAVTYVDEHGAERYGFALVPTSAPGVEFAHDWDAIGMRASDSGSVTFRDVFVAPDGVRPGFPAGRYGVALLDRFLVSGAFHAAASLGIAESAHRRIVASLRTKVDATLDDPFAVMRLAENVVDLASMRAVFDRAGRLIDEHHAAHPTGEQSMGAAQAVYGEVQAAKAHINEAGSRVVDRALALSGGAGFMASHPLAKAWRDARAGAFMHPLGANRAYDFLARTALGVEPR